MLHHDREMIHIIDFGKACLKCSNCSLSKQYQEPNCSSCKWHDGWIKDIRDVATVIYQLVMANAMSATDSENEINRKDKKTIRDKVPHHHASTSF